HGMIPMAAMQTKNTGSTKSEACETKADSSTSRLISTRPRRNTTRFFPHKIFLGSTGNRKSSVRLCRSMPNTLLENTSSEKNTKAGAARTVHEPKVERISVEGLTNVITSKIRMDMIDETKEACSCGSRRKY